MKPIWQTKFSHPDVAHLSTEGGNCLQACVASLLHREIEAIPDFGESGIGWFDELYEWCIKEGLGLVYIPEPYLRLEDSSLLMLNTYCMLVYTVKGFEANHAVIGKTSLREKQDLADGETKWLWHTDVVHDPNRHGAPIETLLYYVYLIPHEPPEKSILEPVSWERMRESMKGLDTRPLVMGMGMACGRGRHHLCTQIGCGCACHKESVPDVTSPRHSQPLGWGDGRGPITDAD